MWCYDAAVGVKKGKKGYVLKWRGRASMSNKLWKSKDKKMAEKWKKLLKNMPAHLYEKLFPDVYSWVKKFTISTPKNKKRAARAKMWQVCRRMKFRGAIQDLSMWACLFGDPAFTKVTVEELEALVPYMKTEIKKFRQEHKWWPHPAVLLHIARRKRKQHLLEVKKQKQEEARGTKRKASEVSGDKKGSAYKHVFWHEQSQCWRALVKKTRMKDGKIVGRRLYEHFPKDKLKDAVEAVSRGLNPKL